MNRVQTRAAALDRAYMQSRVIEASLERLSASVADVDAEIVSDLPSYVRAFDDVVRRLHDARTLAEAAQPH